VNRILRLLPALGAFFVVAIALAGCGNSVPGNAVAAVDGSAIPKSAFDHWFGIAVSTSQGPTAQKVQYDAPNFVGCVANKRKTAPKPAKGQPQTTDAQFKTQCKQEYEGLRDQVMQFLILEKWIKGEAASQGVKVSAKEADKQFEAEKKRSFPKESDFQKFLKTNGMTLADAKFQVRWNTTYTKLREKAVKGAAKVTDKGVAEFYKKNKARFATPPTRDLRVVLTKTKAKADAALQELRGGTSWKAVAKKYSIDQASKAQGGSLLGIAKGSQEKTFDDAIFAAQKGKISGPIKTQFGYYVFQVQKVTPAQQQPLKTASPAIKQQLDAQYKQKADDEFNTALRKKWKEKTNCRDDYVMQQCKNYKPPKTTATAAPGQVQQAPAQPQP
jgi:foldase protein PrsA